MAPAARPNAAHAALVRLEAAHDALIVTHANDLYREILAETPDTPVIDVVRVEKNAPQRAAYNGIGW